MLRRLAAALVILIASSLVVWADDLTNATVTALFGLPLRDSPPGNFFQGKGAEVGAVNPGEQFHVVQQVTVSTLAGSEDWIQVQSADGSRVGWVFSGPSGVASANFSRL